MTLFSNVPSAASVAEADYVLGLQGSTGPGTGNTAKMTLQQIVNLVGTGPFSSLNVTGNASIGGSLTLSADPTTALQAATKQYADKMLPLAGGTMTGELTVATSPNGLNLSGQTLSVSGAGNSVLALQSAGTGSVQIKTGTSGVGARLLDAGGPTTTWLDISPSASATGRVTLTAGGSNTDRSIFLTPAGAGAIRVSGGPFQTDTMQLNPLGSTYTWSGSSALTPGFTPIYLSASVAGTCTDSNVAIALHQVTVNSDTANASGGAATMNLRHNFGGTGAVGNRIGINNVMTQIGTLGTSGSGAFTNSFVGATNWVHTTVNNGGSSLNPGGCVGGLTALNNIVTMDASATFYTGACGTETDFNLQAGSSLWEKIGYWVISSSLDDARGTRTDAAFAVSHNTANTAPGWRNAFQVGTVTLGFGVSNSDGVILGIGVQHNVANAALSSPYKKVLCLHGIDFTPLEVAGNYLGTPAVSIDGTGSLNVSNFSFQKTSSGLSIDATKQRVTAAAVNGSASGSFCFVNDRLYGPNGGIYQINTVGGTLGQQATGSLTVIFPDVSSSPPTNPVTLTGTNATSVQVNLTWSSALTELSLNPSGGTLKMGSGGWTANGSVATSLTSLGPTGAHTTVQEWFTVTNASGVVRYIPAF